MSFLLGVPGRLKTLLDRLTSPRAGYLDNLSAYTTTRGAKLDNLNATITSRADATYYTSTRAAKLDSIDATVSSRAPASTALSTSTWTSTRAAKLDNCDVAISSVTPVQSIQTNYRSTTAGTTGSGEDSKYTDVTITAVTMSKAYCYLQGDASQICRLFNSTTLRISSPAGGTLGGVRWTVVEFK